MNRSTNLYWAAGLIVVALLNVLDVLPDWTTSRSKASV